MFVHVLIGPQRHRAMNSDPWLLAAHAHPRTHGRAPLHSLSAAAAAAAVLLLCVRTALRVR